MRLADPEPVSDIGLGESPGVTQQLSVPFGSWLGRVTR
jgi:hypothetical protein